MKKVVTCALALCCAAGLLAGCASDKESSPTDAPENENASSEVVDGEKEAPEVNDEFQAELTAMFEANSLDNVFSTKVLMNVTTELWVVEDGEEVWENATRSCYSSVGAGLSYRSEIEDARGEIIATASYSDDVVRPAIYTAASNSKLTSLEIFPAGDFEESLKSRVFVRNAEASEIVTSVEADEESGTKVITSEARFEAGSYIVQYVYFVDAESGLLSGIEETTFDMATGDKLYVSRSNIWYDEPIEFASDPYSTVTKAEDACALTVVINPGQEDEETQNFTVAKNTVASIVSSKTVKLFSDAELAEEINHIDTAQAEATVYVTLS